MMKTRVLGILVALALSIGQAASGETATVYYADDLQRTPGVVYVSKGFHTTLRFDREIDGYIPSPQGVVHRS